MKVFPVLGVLVFIVGLTFGVVGGTYSAFDAWGMRRDQERGRATLARLRQEIDSLHSLADAIENDPQMIEKIAREKLGMLRPGEVVYRVEGTGP